MADLRIEVVYALAKEQTIVRVVVAPGATVRDAVERSDILRRLPPGARPDFGIFGRRVAANHPLVDGDRIELYRSLRLEPRAARQARAKQRRPRRR